MNFIIGLPKSQSNFDNIMVVVDRLTKIAHFIPITNIIISYEAFELFIRKIFRYHKISREIINDWNPQVWTTLFRLYGAKIKLSTAYIFKIDI